MKMIGRVFFVPTGILLLMSFVNTLLAGQVNTCKPSIAEVKQKAQKLQIPFIINEGQVDEKVRFYASTFGGSVFVTKDGEIVYALPAKGPKFWVENYKIGTGK